MSTATFNQGFRITPAKDTVTILSPPASSLCSLSKRLSTWAIVIAGGLLSNVWDFWQCLDAGVVTDMERPGTLLNILRCTKQFPTTKTIQLKMSVMTKLGNLAIRDETAM